MIKSFNLIRSFCMYSVMLKDNISGSCVVNLKLVEFKRQCCWLGTHELWLRQKTQLTSYPWNPIIWGSSWFLQGRSGEGLQKLQGALLKPSLTLNYYFCSGKHPFQEQTYNLILKQFVHAKYLYWQVSWFSHLREKNHQQLCKKIIVWSTSEALLSIPTKILLVISPIITLYTRPPVNSWFLEPRKQVSTISDKK